MGRHQFDLFVPPYRFFYFRLVRRLDILPIEAIREQTLGSFSGGGGDRRRGPKRHSVRVRRSTRAFVVARKMVLRNASGSVPLQKFH